MEPRTSDEQLLKWLTAEDDRVVRGHLCPEGCSNSPQTDDLVHIKNLRRLDFETPGCARNLKDAAEAKVLQKRRGVRPQGQGGEEVKGKGVGSWNLPGDLGSVHSSSSSESSKEKKNKKIIQA